MTGTQSRSGNPPVATRDGESTQRLRNFKDRLNDILEEMWQHIGTQHHGVSGRAYSGPPLYSDVSEGGKDWRLEIETPGFEESELQVLLGEQEITVQGEKKLEREETGRNYYLSERSLGQVSRSFALPDNLDTGRIKASYRNGVLTITMPKTAGAKSKTKKIPIKAK